MRPAVCDRDRLARDRRTLNVSLGMRPVGGIRPNGACVMTHSLGGKYTAPSAAGPHLWEITSSLKPSAQIFKICINIVLQWPPHRSSVYGQTGLCLN